MRGKRSKQYRKLMQQFALNFGFREPYQVLVDADIVKDAERFKMDLVSGLERTLHGEVKPMITQCSMRHLYKDVKEPGMADLIERTKRFERRRCDHHPDEYPEPLSALECLSSVVDPKDNKTNKHRYVVASQEREVREKMRTVKGVPLIYINRSVMIMEPMAEASSEVRNKEERSKFRAGIRGKEPATGDKRKREDEDEDGNNKPTAGEDQRASRHNTAENKQKRRGPKGPNPLAVKKSKKSSAGGHKTSSTSASTTTSAFKALKEAQPNGTSAEADDLEEGSKKKRRRKHKSNKAAGEEDGVEPGEGVPKEV